MKILTFTLFVLQSALSFAGVSIGGVRSVTAGEFPYVVGETSGQFVDRIGGIKPCVYDSDRSPLPYPITRLKVIHRDGSSSRLYTIKKDSRELWNLKLQDGDIISLAVNSLFPHDYLPKWKGLFEDRWLIRIPKAE